MKDSARYVKRVELPSRIVVQFGTDGVSDELRVAYMMLSASTRATLPPGGVQSLQPFKNAGRRHRRGRRRGPSRNGS